MRNSIFNVLIGVVFLLFTSPVIRDLEKSTVRSLSGITVFDRYVTNAAKLAARIKCNRIQLAHSGVPSARMTPSRVIFPRLLQNYPSKDSLWSRAMQSVIRIHHRMMLSQYVQELHQNQQKQMNVGKIMRSIQGHGETLTRVISAR